MDTNKELMAAIVAGGVSLAGLLLVLLGLVIVEMLKYVGKERRPYAPWLFVVAVSLTLTILESLAASLFAVKWLRGEPEYLDEAASWFEGAILSTCIGVLVALVLVLWYTRGLWQPRFPQRR
jgi:uncharacterized membrane protein